VINTLWIDVGIICAGGQYVSAIIPVLAASLFFVQYFYLRTSRQLRVRELEAKAPLFTIFTETANGIQHIRAFNWQDAFRSRMQTLLDYSQVPFYSLLCVQRWLTLVMDICVCAVAAILVGLAVYHAGGTSQNAVGLAMVSLVTFSVTMSFVVHLKTPAAPGRLAAVIHSSTRASGQTSDGFLPARTPHSGFLKRKGLEND